MSDLDIFASQKRPPEDLNEKSVKGPFFSGIAIEKKIGFSSDFTFLTLEMSRWAWRASWELKTFAPLNVRVENRCSLRRLLCIPFPFVSSGCKEKPRFLRILGASRFPDLEGGNARRARSSLPCVS